MVSVASPLVRQLIAWSCGGFLLGVGSSHYLADRARPRLVLQPSALEPGRAVDAHQFTGDAGIMLKFVHPAKTGDFEATMVKLQEALAASPIPTRRLQALGWRVFRSSASARNGDVVYVFEFDPIVPGADYTISRILTEAFPADASDLFERYAAAAGGGQYVVDLALVAAFDRSVPPVSHR